MHRRGRVVIAAATAALLLAACSTDVEPAEPAPSSAATRAPEADPPAPAPVPTPPVEQVVIGHATLGALDLPGRLAARMVAGQVTEWRGRRVVAGLPPRRAVRAVERDPGTLAVVPIDVVGPSVVVATVDGADPVRDDPRAIDLTVVGDVMLVRGVPDPAAALAPMRRRLRSAEITVGNLESTLSRDGSPTQGGDSFGATPDLLDPLRGGGFDALSLANNHARDFGTGALVDTLRTLRAGPIPSFGAGRTRAEAARAAYVERDGVRFAFLGFNAIGETPAAGPGRPGALSVRMPPRTGPFVPADLDVVTSAIRRAERRADVVVVLPHWGTQYTHRPEPIQRSVARQLVAAGADLVVGGHPHWVQGVDLVDGVPVLHSLGNFVFDMDFFEETMEGVVLETTFWGDQLKALRLVPYRMDAGSFAPRVVDGPAAERILDDVRSTSTGPFAP